MDLKLNINNLIFEMNFTFIEKTINYRLKDIGEVMPLTEYKESVYKEIEWEADRVNRVRRELGNMNRIAVRQLFNTMRRKKVLMLEYK